MMYNLLASKKGEHFLNIPLFLLKNLILSYQEITNAKCRQSSKNFRETFLLVLSEG